MKFNGHILIVLLATPFISSEEQRSNLDDIFTPLLRTIKFISSHGSKQFTENREYRRILEKTNVSTKTRTFIYTYN